MNAQSPKNQPTSPSSSQSQRYNAKVNTVHTSKKSLSILQFSLTYLSSSPPPPSPSLIFNLLPRPHLIIHPSSPSNPPTHSLTTLPPSPPKMKCYSTLSSSSLLPTFQSQFNSVQFQSQIPSSQTN